MSQQPKWKCIANLGDVNPIDYGGYFVFIDETGVYDAEAELLITPEDEDGQYQVYRFILEPCTYIDGVLSDNRFHPDHPAWFAKPESAKAERPQDSTYLSNVAECTGQSVETLIEQLTSNKAVERAFAYQSIGQYHGFENLDQYPLTLTKNEAIERYKGIH